MEQSWHPAKNPCLPHSVLAEAYKTHSGKDYIDVPATLPCTLSPCYLPLLAQTSLTYTAVTQGAT